MEGDGDYGRKRRRAAAPTFDSSASLAATRSTRSSAANGSSDGDAAFSPAKSRPVRSRRATSQRRQVDDDDGENGEEEEDALEEYEQGGEEDEDEDEEEYDGGGQKASQRPSRRRTTSRQQEDEAIGSTHRPNRQRSIVNLRSDGSHPRTLRIVRSVKPDEDGEEEQDEAATTRSPNQQPAEQFENNEAADDSAEVTPPRGKRLARSKSQGSPAKGLNEAVDTSLSDTLNTRRERLPEEVDGGWIEEIEDGAEARETYITVVQTLRAWLKAESNQQLISFFERGPSSRNASYSEASKQPITLQSIERRANANEYPSSVDFETDMLQLFRNGRRYFDAGSEAYGGVCTLQRMYQHITQSVEAVREAIEDDVRQRNYASVRYGPCQEPEGQGYGESPCDGEILPVSRHYYKGTSLSVGMWVHLSNPTDPARPIVAQIFKTRTEDLEDRRQDWITACWFLRPEQSRHPRTMTFWEDEVIKTSQTVEHHVEDVLEVVCVNFYTKASRGTPADGEGGWHVGDPLYICENRYQSQQDAFFKIKNWASCMPDEARNKRFQLIEYDQPINLPDKLPSPFLRGVEGPGMIIKEPSTLRPISTPIVGLPRARGPNGEGADVAGKSEDYAEIPQLFKEWRDEVQAQRRAFLRAKAEQKAAKPEQASDPQLPGQNSLNLNANGQPETAIGLSSNGQAQPLRPPTSPLPSSQSQPPARMPPITEAVDRSLSSILTHMDIQAYFEALPESTQRLFLQDAETGKTIWYPAPPVVGLTDEALQAKWNDGERFRAHSLDYLYFLANESGSSQKRRLSTAQEEEQESLPTSLPQSEEQQYSRLSAPQPMSLDLVGNPDIDVDRLFSGALRDAAEKLSSFIGVQDV